MGHVDDPVTANAVEGALKQDVPQTSRDGAQLLGVGRASARNPAFGACRVGGCALCRRKAVADRIGQRHGIRRTIDTGKPNLPLQRQHRLQRHGVGPQRQPRRVGHRPDHQFRVEPRWQRQPDVNAGHTLQRDPALRAALHLQHVSAPEGQRQRHHVGPAVLRLCAEDRPPDPAVARTPPPQPQRGAAVQRIGIIGMRPPRRIAARQKDRPAGHPLAGSAIGQHPRVDVAAAQHALVTHQPVFLDQRRPAALGIVPPDAAHPVARQHARPEGGGPRAGKDPMPVREFQIDTARQDHQPLALGADIAAIARTLKARAQHHGARRTGQEIAGIGARPVRRAAAVQQDLGRHDPFRPQQPMPRSDLGVTAARDRGAGDPFVAIMRHRVGSGPSAHMHRPRSEVIADPVHQRDRAFRVRQHRQLLIVAFDIQQPFARHLAQVSVGLPDPVAEPAVGTLLLASVFIDQLVADHDTVVAPGLVRTLPLGLLRQRPGGALMAGPFARAEEAVDYLVQPRTKAPGPRVAIDDLRRAQHVPVARPSIAQAPRRRVVKMPQRQVVTVQRDVRGGPRR